MNKYYWLFFMLLLGIIGCATNDKKMVLIEEISTIITNKDKKTFYKPSKSDAVIALSLLKKKGATQFLIEQYKLSQDKFYKADILRCLIWNEDKDMVSFLKDVLKNEKYGFSRKMAAMSLERITGEKYVTEKYGFEKHTPEEILQKAAELLQKSEKLQKKEMNSLEADKKLMNYLFPNNLEKHKPAKNN